MNLDSMLSSYLLQVTDHRGLQVQNGDGEWIDCPPVRGTVVVALGQGMESITQGICTSTTHRVISPPAGEGARYSIPFFQGVGLDAQFEAMSVPEEIRKRLMKGKKASDVEFTFTKDAGYNCLGEAIFMNRVKKNCGIVSLRIRLKVILMLGRGIIRICWPRYERRKLRWINLQMAMG